MGQMLLAGKASGEVAGKGRPKNVTAGNIIPVQCDDLGLTRKESADAQLLADLPAAEWAKRKNMGEDAIRHCRSYALAAERKMGQMLRETERAKGATAGGKEESPRGNYTAPRDSEPTLASLGRTLPTSNRTSPVEPTLAAMGPDVAGD